MIFTVWPILHALVQYNLPRVWVDTNEAHVEERVYVSAKQKAILDVIRVLTSVTDDVSCLKHLNYWAAGHRTCFLISLLQRFPKLPLPLAYGQGCQDALARICRVQRIKRFSRTANLFF